MDVIIIDSEAFRQLKADLLGEVKKVVKEVISNHETSQKSDWIVEAEAKKLLPYKSRTSWQKLRDSGKIIWSKDEKLIQYSRKSIEAYIEKHRMV